jgi:hypothetical protein
MLNRFVVDSENTVREMVELVVTNWLGAQRFGANDHYRKRVGNSRGAVSRKCERNGGVLDHCQHVRRINSIGINRMAADTWGTIYPKLLPPLQIAGKDDGPIQHQHTLRTCSRLLIEPRGSCESSSSSTHPAASR